MARRAEIATLMKVEAERAFDEGPNARCAQKVNQGRIPGPASILAMKKRKRALEAIAFDF